MTRRTAYLAVAVVGLLAGVAQGFGWGAIAPQQRWVVYADTAQYLPLPTEANHRFTAIGMFASISVVIGIVLAVAAWQIRFARGVQMLLAAAGGVAVGSVAALLIGEALLGGVIPAEVADAGVAQDTMVTMIPGVSWIMIVIAPAATAIVYSGLAAWHPDPLLGRAVGGAGRAGAGETEGSDPLSTMITAPIPLPGFGARDRGPVPPGSDQPGSEPVSDRPVSDQPVSDQPVSDQPVSDQPVSDQPVADRPASGQIAR